MTNTKIFDPFPQLPRPKLFEVGGEVTRRSADEKLEAAKVAIAKVKGKPGRPVAPRPWVEAGVSRMTWYRRQKEVEKRKSSSSPSE
jgi:hypothetical protein